ncbi:hypothetical protein XELAEV_18026953mg [Xenopus laevis]|uniref:Uncharacterized protein n=1 Tax=Xenopus laevis TaxID=8355 RepID=A0A974CWN6_XENLA|nr:hypothetical protein XELAEV_18026953mg [Xenopus laevis]
MRRKNRPNSTGTAQRTPQSRKDKKIERFFAKTSTPPDEQEEPNMADQPKEQRTRPSPTPSQKRPNPQLPANLMEVISALPQKGLPLPQKGTAQRTPQSRKDKKIERFFSKTSTPLDEQEEPNMADQSKEQRTRPSPTPSQKRPNPQLPANLMEVISALPQKGDLNYLLEDIKATQKQETAEIKAELGALAHRLEGIEDDQRTLKERMGHQELEVTEHGKQLMELRWLLDDAQNRSPRNNLRIRGLPEDIQSPEAKQLLTQLFKRLLDRDLDTEIMIERLHRVGVPRKGQPRDLLCCLHNYTLKEQILKKARDAKTLKIEEDDIEIYQDLSYSTVLQRRLLKPLTTMLYD